MSQHDSGLQAFKSALGLTKALLPVLYCGGLVYYFLDVSGSVENVSAIGLGPTVVGLAAVGLLFCIPLILKIVRILKAPPPPGSGRGPEGPADDDENGFDADAAIARYMAQQSAQAAPSTQATRPALKSGGPAQRPGFGRKIS
jgi:hypothetical protein